jgi:hypothetical protein
MRTVLLAASVAAALAVPASAGPLDRCNAYADAPTAPHSFGAWASGGFACDAARPALSVTVCLEVLEAGSTAWEPVACESASASDVAGVSAQAYGCRWGVTLVRSVATGFASTGESGRAESLPVPFYCTPL